MTDKKSQAEAVGHIPSGLFIITSYDGETKAGYLASWVQQISFDPLLVAFTIKPDRPGYSTITSGKPFAINIVGDHEMGYLKHFWSGFDPEKRIFDQIEHEVTTSGALLLKQAKSAMECRFVSTSKPGDHELVIAEVTNSHHFSAESKPKVHIRKSGLDY